MTTGAMCSLACWLACLWLCWYRNDNKIEMSMHLCGLAPNNNVSPLARLPPPTHTSRLSCGFYSNLSEYRRKPLNLFTLVSNARN